MKRVLIIAYAFPPLSVAGTFRPLRFVKYLPELGWNPIIITIRGRKDIPRDLSLLKEIPKEISVSRTRTFEALSKIYPNSKSKYIDIGEAINRFNNWISIPDPLVYWVPSAILRGISINRSRNYDALITTSPPHSSHLAGLFLSRLLKIPWIADFRDPWVDNAYSFGHKGRMRIFLEKWLEKIVITGATKVIANTFPNREKLLKRYGSFLPLSKFVTITNGFDRKYIDSVASKSFDKFTICHIGGFYSAMKPYFFFEAFANWLNHHKEKKDLRNSIQILLIGSGHDEIKNILRKLNLQDCVHLVPKVSHREALSFAKAADLLLVSLGFSNEADGWIPLKLYDYLGCRRPILGILPDGSAAANLIKSTKTGYVVSHPDYHAVSNILDNAYSEYKTQRCDASFYPKEIELNKYEICTLTKELAGLLDDAISGI